MIAAIATMIYQHQYDLAKLLRVKLDELKQKIRLKIKPSTGITNRIEYPKKAHALSVFFLGSGAIATY